MFEPLPDLAYFRLLVGDSQAIPLLEAAASIGVVAYPALDLQGTLSTFDGLAGQVADSCRGASTEMARLQRVSRFFYGKLGFAGNVNNYYDPDNSFVHRVLETRRGIPITLALLFGELARHVGLDAAGVAFPGHFLVKVRLHDGVVVIDPFTGQSLDHDELQRRASAHGGALERLLRPASPQQILIRMLHNLQAIYEQQGSTELLEKVTARLRILLADPERASDGRP
ncbi:MAG: transglutaminase family protein [Burkholderiaceae bacterium]|nr:transglutaminase family protein [Burkholderiaceae bacterium]